MTTDRTDAPSPQHFQDATGEWRHLGAWRKQPADPRDYQLETHMPHLAAKAVSGALPTNFLINIPTGLDVEDQSQLGSCTAFGSGGGFQQRNSGVGNGVFYIAKLAQYFWSRQLGGFPTNQDTGAYVRDAIKVLAQYGAAHQDVYPYNIQNFTQTPPQSVIDDAKKHVSLQYVSVPVDINSIKASIASGYPVVFGFDVPSAFMSTGADGMVSTSRTNIIGGHCMRMHGYDDSTRRIAAPNSWSKNWGKGGWCYMDYDWLIALGSDMWIIADVTHDVAPTPPTPTSFTFNRDGGIDGKLVAANPAYWTNRFVNTGSPVGASSRFDWNTPIGSKLITVRVSLVSGNLDVHDGWSDSATRISGAGDHDVDVVTDDQGFYWFSSPDSAQIASLKLVSYWK